MVDFYNVLNMCDSFSSLNVGLADTLFRRMRQVQIKYGFSLSDMRKLAKMFAWRTSFQFEVRQFIGLSVGSLGVEFWKTYFETNEVSETREADIVALCSISVHFHHPSVACLALPVINHMLALGQKIDLCNHVT